MMKRLGYLILFLVLAFAGYVGFKVGSVYLERWTVERFLERVAKNSLHPVYRDTVDAYIRSQIRDEGFPFQPEDIRFYTSIDGSLTVSVWYRREAVIIPENPYIPPYKLSFEFTLEKTVRPQGGG